MIRYSNEEGFIKAKGIKFREGQDKKIRLPKVAVGVFSYHLFDDVVQKFNCRRMFFILTCLISLSFLYHLISCYLFFKVQFVSFRITMSYTFVSR